MDFGYDLFFTNSNHLKKVHKASYLKEKSHFEKPSLIC